MGFWKTMGWFFWSSNVLEKSTNHFNSETNALGEPVEAVLWFLFSCGRTSASAVIETIKFSMRCGEVVFSMATLKATALRFGFWPTNPNSYLILYLRRDNGLR
ncbi:hypothetical protein AMECASPLE_011883 [Ameca splendens]|uniref:Uncharacterized protein n=1 Tax=Ameca splendens TaxID=208324 RepID=A0ABV0ZZ22_9TELE